jgi:DNA polymerase III alpha subunit
MKQNNFGELVFDQSDLCDFLMQGKPLDCLQDMIVDSTVDLNCWPDFVTVSAPQKEQNRSCSPADFHERQQSLWHMPQEYKNLDIAEHVLSMCNSEAELQRCGTELLLYQERNLFNLLRYLKYLVDVMESNNIIWGVGRGSSVASFVLYKLGVHRIDSLYYNLDITEFLR